MEHTAAVPICVIRTAAVCLCTQKRNRHVTHKTDFNKNSGCEIERIRS